MAEVEKSLSQKDINIFRYYIGLFYRAIIDFAKNEKTYMQAHALAYRSLLNLVPMLAFLFSFFALFKQMVDVDLEVKLREIISQYLLPQSAAGKMVLDQVMTFVHNAKAGSYIGFIMLLVTSILVFNAIDRAINYTFKIERPRNIFQKMVLFTAILVWGPLLVGLSVYLTAKLQFRTLLTKIHTANFPQEIPISSFLQSLMTFGHHFGTYLLSFGLIFITLFLLYKIFPNTKIENRACLFGAFWGTLFWEITKWGFSYYAGEMLKSREKIYASLAVFLVFLIWMYITWVIVLFGAELTYVYQHYRYEVLASPLKRRKVNRLWLAFQVMLEVGLRFLRGEEPASIKELAQRFGVGLPELKEVVSCLEGARLLSKVIENGKQADEKYQPGKELNQIYLNQLIQAIDPDWKLEDLPYPVYPDPKLQAESNFIFSLFQKLKFEFDQTLSQRSLKEILENEILAQTDKKENSSQTKTSG